MFHIRLGVREARESPSTPPSHNPAFKIDSNHDDLGTYQCCFLMMNLFRFISLTCLLTH